MSTNLLVASKRSRVARPRARVWNTDLDGIFERCA